MATFAIFYDLNDLQAMADAAVNPGLTGAERSEINRYWNGGLRDWQTAPTAPTAQSCVDIPFDPTGNPAYAGKTITDLGNGKWRVCDPDIKIIVVSGAQVTKAGLINWMRTMGNKYPVMQYMTAIADDLQLTAIEPWTV